MLLQHSLSSHGLAWAQGEHRSPLFQQENRITELHSPSSVIPLPVLEWAGTGLCAKILLFFPWRWEKRIPNGAPSVVPLHIPRHTILIPPKQISCSGAASQKGSGHVKPSINPILQAQMQSCPGDGVICSDSGIKKPPESKCLPERAG